MFVSLVAAGADPEWVAERMRVSMFKTVYDAMIKRKRDEWERCRFEAILPAMAAGAKIKWDDFKNPYKLEEKQQGASASDIQAARQRLKELKNGRK